MHGTVFKFYQPPTPLEPNANLQAQDLQAKRSRGRPKGSKNKPKEGVNLNTAPSAIGLQSITESESITRHGQSQEAEYEQHEGERVILKQGQHECERTEESNGRLSSSNKELVCSLMHCPFIVTNHYHY